MSSKLVVDERYLEKRKLSPPLATPLNTWGFIVGVGLTGLYTGFNAGLEYGLGSMIVAHGIVTLVVVTLSFDLSEMATTFPFASGSASFATAAFGAGAACLVGFSYLLEVLMFTSLTTDYLADVIVQAGNMNPDIRPLWWIVTIMFCVIINMRPKAAHQIITGFSAMAVVVLAVLLAILFPLLDFTKMTETKLEDGSISNAFLPFGFQGVVKSLPYAFYLLICFEYLPCSSEEVIDVGKNLHKGMFYAIATKIVLAWPVLIVASALPREEAIKATSYLSLGLQTAFDSDVSILYAVGLLGMFASQMALFFAATRFLYGLSRGGYLPTFLSKTTQEGAPYVANIAVGFLVTVLSLAVFKIPNVTFSDIFLNIGVLFALVAFVVEPIVFIKLRLSLSQLPRPFKSPIGIAGAAVNFLLALACLVSLIVVIPLYRYLGIAFVGFMLLIALLYALFIRRNLKNSPEKVFIQHQLKERFSEQLGKSDEENSGNNNSNRGITGSGVAIPSIAKTDSRQMNIVKNNSAENTRSTKRWSNSLNINW